MKYFILLIFCLSAAHAEKERGGGSLERLLLRAGISIAEQPKTQVEHDIRKAFFILANQFMLELRNRRANGQMSYINFAGQRIQLQESDLVKLNSAVYQLDKKGLVIHKRLSSSRGDNIGFINNSKDMSLLVSSTEFEKVLNIANQDLALGLGSALVGHELLSLVGLEDSDHFAVSATFAEDDIWNSAYLRCGHDLFVAPFYLTMDRFDRKIKHWNSPVFFPIDKIEIDLSEKNRRLQLSANSGGFRLRITNDGDRYVLEYEQGEKISGKMENFVTWDSDRFFCVEVDMGTLPPVF